MSTEKPQSIQPEPPEREDRVVVLLAGRLLEFLCGDVRRVLTWLYRACALLVVVDLAFFFGFADKEAHYPWENGIGFYAAYGFVACVLLVLISKFILRPLIIRKEDYYE